MVTGWQLSSARGPLQGVCRALLVLLLTAGRTIAASAQASAAPAATGGSAEIVGIVQAPDGVPIAGARVGVLPAGDRVPATAPRFVVTTRDDGRFRIAGLPPGDFTLAVRRIGFRAEVLTAQVPMPPGGPVVIPLEPVPLSLEPVHVRGTRAAAAGPFREFEERKARGFGYFLTRREIEARRPARSTDLFRSVPNMQLGRDEGMPVVRIRGRRCDPLVWIDRVPLVGGFPDLDAIPPKAIEAVEIYSGVSTIPADLIGPRDAGACGVIVIWTRHGDKPAPAPLAVPAAEPGADLVALLDARQIYTADQVDSMAAPLADAPVAPVYPEALRASGVAGRVLAEFVVDTVGRVEESSVSIVSATNESFGTAVRVALHAARFAPAVRAGRVVRQLVLLPVRFDLQGREGRER